MNLASDPRTRECNGTITCRSELHLQGCLTVRTVTKPHRSTILSTADELINGQRATDYGDASENFQRIADLWKPILGADVTATDVALCLTQLKVARLITAPAHSDSWIDACGYLALGGEIAQRGAQ